MTETCRAFAELAGTGFYHPVNCELHLGHEGDHRMTLTLQASGTESELIVTWPPNAASARVIEPTNEANEQAN